MPAHLLDDVLIKVTRVAQQLARDVICVLQALKDRLLHGEMTSLSKLHPVAGGAEVSILDPGVVSFGSLLGDVVFEDDHIRIGHRLAIV